MLLTLLRWRRPRRAGLGVGQNMTNGRTHPQARVHLSELMVAYMLTLAKAYTPWTLESRQQAFVVPTKVFFPQTSALASVVSSESHVNTPVLVALAHPSALAEVSASMAVVATARANVSLDSQALFASMNVLATGVSSAAGEVDAPH